MKTGRPALKILLYGHKGFYINKVSSGLEFFNPNPNYQLSNNWRGPVS